MLSQSQQRRVWEGILSGEIRANYFAELSNKYHGRQRGATWMVLLLSSGAVAAFLYTGPFAEIAAWLRPLLPLLTTAVSVYMLATQNHKVAIESADLHSRWSSLARKYEALWEDIYADDAEERLQNLDQEAIELSKIGTAFPYREKAMRKWQDHIERHHAAHASA